MPPPCLYLQHVLPRLHRKGVIEVDTESKKKMGRPIKADEPRNISLHLRISKAESDRINDCSKRLGLNRTDTIMQGISLLEQFEDNAVLPKV